MVHPKGPCCYFSQHEGVLLPPSLKSDDEGSLQAHAAVLSPGSFALGFVHACVPNYLYPEK